MSRAQLIRFITFLGGLYFVVEFLFPESVMQSFGIAEFHDNISYGFITVGSLSFGLGIINLLRYHGAKIIFRRDGAFFSGVLIFALIMTLVIGWLDWRASSEVDFWQQKARSLIKYSVVLSSSNGKESNLHANALPPKATFEQRVYLLSDALNLFATDIDKTFPNISGETISLSLKKRAEELSDNALLLREPSFNKSLVEELESSGVALSGLARIRYEANVIRNMNQFIVEGLFNSLGAAMFSLLALYIANAAFKAFRVRSLDSLLMMIAAVLVILGQTFVGLLIAPQFSDIRLWLLEVPNSAAFRAIKFGAAIAGLVMAFRMWLSIESGSFSIKRNKQ
jgi:hypothetical protein